MKENWRGFPLWIGGDETLDIVSSYVLHIMPGKLEIGMYKTPYLVECTFLKWRMSSLLHKPGLQFYASFGNSSLLQVLMSDTVSYRLSCGKILKNQVNRDLPHLTCLIHPLHHLCVNICSMFPEANTLVKNGKMIFLKSPLCVTLWKQSTDLPLPPKSFVTHWNTWLETLLWYFKQLYAFATAVNTLDP